MLARGGGKVAAGLVIIALLLLDHVPEFDRRHGFVFLKCGPGSGDCIFPKFLILKMVYAIEPFYF